MTDQKQPENVECFQYFCRMIANDANFMLEIKSRIVMANAAFDNKEIFSSVKLPYDVARN
jgi:hypothetical protein